MKEFFSVKGLPEKELSAVYGKIISVDSIQAVAEMETDKGEKLKLVFSGKKSLGKAKSNDSVRAIGELVFNNNEQFFNARWISVLSEQELELAKKIIEIEKKEFEKN